MLTKEELGFLKEEIDKATDYLKSGELGEDEWDSPYLEFQEILSVATVLWEACADFMKGQHSDGS